MADQPAPTNFLNKVHAPTTIRPAGYWKSVMLDILAVGTAVWTGLFYWLYLEHYVSILTVLASALLMLIFSVFQSLLVSSSRRRQLVVVLQTFGLLALFLLHPVKIVLVTLVLVFIFLWAGQREMRSRLDNGVEVRFFSAIWPQVTRCITALCFFAILMYFPSLSEGKQILISESTFSSFYSFSAGIVQRLYPDINMETSIMELARGIAREQIVGNRQMLMVPQNIRDGLIEQAASTTIQNLERSLDISIRSEDSVSLTLYKYLASQLNRWQTDYGVWFLVGWVVAVFLVIKSFGAIAAVFVASLATLLYHLLVAAEYIRIKGEGVTREVPTLT